jgi:hypothetical protein
VRIGGIHIQHIMCLHRLEQLKALISRCSKDILHAQVCMIIGLRRRHDCTALGAFPKLPLAPDQVYFEIGRWDKLVAVAANCGLHRLCLLRWLY